MGETARAAVENRSHSPETPSEIKAARNNLLICASLILCFFLLAGYYLSLPGLTWDESIDIPYAETYRTWFADLPQSFEGQRFRDEIAMYASHPPLERYAIALTTQVFANSMSRLYAARVATSIWMAMLIAAVFFFALMVKGRLAAVGACVSLILMPRFFAHSMLAGLDLPMALWWFAAAASFYMAIDDKRWSWVAGAALGLACLTKVNALALPVVLWPWGLFFHRKKALRPIIYSAVLAPVIFFALWPFLWLEPVVNVGKYLGEKFAFVVSIYAWFGVDLRTAGDALHRMMKRTDVSVLYFGKVHTGPPWHYAFVMTAITTPLAVLAAAVAGALRWLRERNEVRVYSFLIWNVLFWLGAFAVGLSKPYDGVRLFLLIFPFIAILAGIGLDWGFAALSKRWSRTWPAAVVLAVYAGILAVGFLRYEPFGLSYYNAAVGGLPGAAAKGFEVTYWGETIDNAIFEHVNQNAPEGSRVAAFPLERRYVENMRFFGLLRADIKDVTTADDWDYMIIANRRDSLLSREDISGLTGDAIVTKSIEGVPVAWLVRRKR